MYILLVFASPARERVVLARALSRTRAAARPRRATPQIHTHGDAEAAQGDALDPRLGVRS
jgi:hypothetical protein